MVPLNFLRHDYGFKLALVLVASFSIFTAAYGQSSPIGNSPIGNSPIGNSPFAHNGINGKSGTFSHLLLPEKMLENTNGILEVYSAPNMGILTQPIKDLTVRSSDPSIIQVIGVEENENGMMTDVKIKAVGPGTANIALIAPGFPTDEFPLTVYGSHATSSQLLLKITPNSFLLDGPTKGYVTVELANSGGYPVSASKDTTVNLSVNDYSLLDLKDSQLVIKRGDYFAIGEFKVKNAGTAILFANSGSMNTTSGIITINPDYTAPHLQLYVYPTKISSSYSSHSYAIVQLQDANGVPVKAREDISVSLKISGGPTQVGASSSPTTPDISGEDVVINKGSYWGYSTLTTLAGITGATYSVSIAANNYPSSDPQELDVVNATLVAQTPVQYDPLPVLATGQDELIGVLELADANGNPIMANNDLVINMDTTDKNSLFIQPVKIGRGFSSQPVFAQTGLTAPSQIEIYDTTDNSKLTSPIMYGPDAATLSLVADTLAPGLVPGMESPLILYMVDANSNSSRYFPDTVPLSISNPNIMEIEPKTISKGEGPVLLNTKALKAGTTDFVITAGSFENDPTITILSPQDTQLQLSSPPTIISDLASRFYVQLLDANGLPVPAEHDTKVAIVSNDKTVINPPQSLTIKKGDSFALLDVKPTKAGNTELSMISDGLPLLKTDLTVSSVTPNLIISSPSSVNASSIFAGTVIAKYNNIPLSGLKVDWNVKGAQILKSDSQTDNGGNANIRLLAQDPRVIEIQANVTGGIYGTTNLVQGVMINQGIHIIKTANAATPNPNAFTIFGINPLILIIPAAAVASVIILKKKKKLGKLQIKYKLGKKALSVKQKIIPAQAS